MTRLLKTLTLCVGLIAACPALAADDPTPEELERGKALYEQGVRSFDKGDYDQAIQLWNKAYEVTPLAAIKNNVAKAYEDDGRPAEALNAYKAYLAVAPDADRNRVEKKIKSLEIVVSALEDSEPEPVVAAAPAPAAPAPKEAESTTTVDKQRSYRGLAVAGLALGATGAAVGGTLLSTSARGSASDAAQAGCIDLGGTVLCDGATGDTLSSDRFRYGLGVGLVGGGIALGAGAVVLAISPKKRTSDLALVPALNGLALTGRL